MWSMAGPIFNSSRMKKLGILLSIGIFGAAAMDVTIDKTPSPQAGTLSLHCEEKLPPDRFPARTDRTTYYIPAIQATIIKTEMPGAPTFNQKELGPWIVIVSIKTG